MLNFRKFTVDMQFTMELKMHFKNNEKNGIGLDTYRKPRLKMLCKQTDRDYFLICTQSYSVTYVMCIYTEYNVYISQ